jgi:hypothetical protein
MAMNLATSMEDDDTRAQFHELFERTFNRKEQTRSEILELGVNVLLLVSKMSRGISFTSQHSFHRH